MTEFRYVLPCVLLLAVMPAAVVWGQSSMPEMPSMQMPEAPKPQDKKPVPAMKTPGDMKRGADENAHAHAAEQSVRDSEAQQRHDAGTKAAKNSDEMSVQHDTYGDQEFEAVGIRTGSDVSAPELLGVIADRAALTLATFMGWAEAGNPTLAEARAIVKRSEGEARQAGLMPDPIVGYSGEHLRGGSYGGGENGAFAEQTFVLGGKLALRRAIHARQADADKMGLEAQTMRVRNDVERAFYDALAAQSQVDVRRKLMGLARDASRTAHELANLGQQDAPEVLDAEVELEQAKVEYVEAQRKYVAAFAVLETVAARPDEPLARLEGDLEHVPALETGAVVANIMEASPTVRASLRDVDVAKAKLHNAKREVVPDLRVQAGAWWSGEYLDGTAPTGKPAGWMGFAQVGVQLPLWNRNQGNVEAAGAEAARAQAEVMRTRLVMKQRAEPLLQRYESARFQAERYRDQLLPRAERAHDLYVIKYQQMAAAYPQVLTSERTALRLRVAYLEALNEEWRAAIALQNDTLEGGLEVQGLGKRE